jgi:Large polyvalent protein-associated domain 7
LEERLGPIELKQEAPTHSLPDRDLSSPDPSRDCYSRATFREPEESPSSIKRGRTRRLPHRARAELGVIVRRGASGDEAREAEAVCQETNAIIQLDISTRTILAGFRWTSDRRGINYTLNGSTVLRDEGQRIIFTDASDQALRAGLLLSRERWGLEIRIDGTDEFKARAKALAAELNIPIGYPQIRVQLPPVSPRTSDTSTDRDRTLGDISAMYGKPIALSEACIGRQHTGRLVAIRPAVNGASLIVLDVGRTLVALLAPAGVGEEWRNSVGRLIRAQAMRPDLTTGNPVWRAQQLQPVRPEIEHGQ